MSVLSSLWKCKSYDGEVRVVYSQTCNESESADTGITSLVCVSVAAKHALSLSGWLLHVGWAAQTNRYVNRAKFRLCTSGTYSPPRMQLDFGQKLPDSIAVFKDTHSGSKPGTVWLKYHSQNMWNTNTMWGRDESLVFIWTGSSLLHTVVSSCVLHRKTAGRSTSD